MRKQAGSINSITTLRRLWKIELRNLHPDADKRGTNSEVLCAKRRRQMLAGKLGSVAKQAALTGISASQALEGELI